MRSCPEMSDEPSRSTGFSTPTIVFLAVVTAAVVVTAGMVLDVDGPSWNDDRGPTINETEVTSLETRAPRCGTHRSSNSSTAVQPADGGHRISINDTVPVATRDSELTADVAEVADNRYVLDLRRTAGTRSADCYLETRFDVTVTVPQRDDYTLLVTVDGTRIQRLVSEPGGSGVGSSNSDPRPPSMNDSEWAAALNASDEYFYNETGERPAKSGSDGDDSSAGATGGDSGDESDGASSSGGDTSG